MEFVDKTTIKQIKFNFRKDINCLLFVEYDEKISLANKKLPSIVTGILFIDLKKIQKFPNGGNIEMHHYIIV